MDKTYTTDEMIAMILKDPTLRFANVYPVYTVFIDERGDLVVGSDTSGSVRVTSAFLNSRWRVMSRAVPAWEAIKAFKTQNKIIRCECSVCTGKFSSSYFSSSVCVCSRQLGISVCVA